MAVQKKGWFEKHQGLITFLGYLATVIIGGISLYSSNSKSADAIKLARDQFQYELLKDAQNKIEESKKNAESEKKFRHQDSLNKHQESINQQQLGYFKSQTQTAIQQLKYFRSQTEIAKQQLGYFRKQTDISETQLKNADLIYKRQLEENKPSFTIQQFTIDSSLNKPLVTIRGNVYNSGKREAVIKKITAFLWNPEHVLLDIKPIPVGGDSMQPGSQNSIYFAMSDRLTMNKVTLVMIQIFYQDKAVSEIQTYRSFFRFNQFKPLEAIQIDEIVQQQMLERINMAGKADHENYLSFN
ncbi:MAG: hypothetical protein JST50_19745 [Bacteroidetes bacterium]|jgi:hypothetical protein|nr:hypothetical protein [Bacteroidota bacterium]